MGKRGNIFVYKDNEYDSPEETYFAMWLEELQEKEYIKKWKRNTEAYELAPELKNIFGVKFYKNRRTKGRSQTIWQNFAYTPDFVIVWDAKAKGVLFDQLNENVKIERPFIGQEKDGEIISIVEIKPSFDKHNMTRLFRQIQKMLYSTQNKYVNLIEVQDLFAKTYTPMPFLFTKTGKKKKITKWIVKNINKFLNGVNK